MRKLGFISVCGLVLSVLAGCGATPAAHLQVSARSVPSGRGIVISGAGFPARSTVDLVLHGPDNPNLRRSWPVSAAGTFRLIRMGPFVSAASRGPKAASYYAGPFLPGTWSLSATDGPAKAAVSFTITPARWGFSAADIAAAYNFTPLYKLGYQGQGERVAIVVGSSTPTLSRDVQVFSAANHLPPVNLQVLYPDGNPGYTVGWYGETTMDVELIHALAPKAQIDLVVSSNLLGSFRYITDHHVASIISFSAVLGTESSQPKSYWVGLDSVFKDAAQAGISILKGAGDKGALSGTSHPVLYFPPDSPWVTAIGGTTLLVGPHGRYLGEQTWGHPTALGFVGTGGGKSTVFAEPSWQHGAAVPHDGVRNVPDVAMNANPYTGMRLYIQGRWVLSGGDSATGPQWAALVALADQVARRPLGFLNPRLYAIGRSSNRTVAFHDVVYGYNGYYHAKEGWNFTSGWGSPNAYALVRLLTVGADGEIPPYRSSSS